MSDCSNSSINKYIIVQPIQTGGGSFSGLTVCGGSGISVDIITGCTVDGVNVNGGLFKDNTLTIPSINAITFSGGTFYGDGSNLIGVSTVDSYMTGGTYSNGFIYFSGSGNFSQVIVDVTSLVDNWYLTGSTLNGNVLELSRNGGLPPITTDLSSLILDRYVNKSGDTMTGTLYVRDVIPDVDNTYSLGTNIKRFRELNTYSGSTSIWEVGSNTRLTTNTVQTLNLDLGQDTSGNTRIITANNSIIQDDILYGGTF